MSKKDEQSPNSIDLITDLLEEILLRLPLKSLLRCKGVSKQWRLIVESRSFVERRMKLEKKPKLLAAANHKTESWRFKGDDEIEMVYLYCEEATTRPSLSCEGLICFPVPGWINVLNPSTGESLRFPTGTDPVTNRYNDEFLFPIGCLWSFFPGYAVMGFGKDIVSGSYKLVRMFFDPKPYCRILDVNTGEWRELSPPSLTVDAGRKSAYVNGSVYWLEMNEKLCILALDLHTEEFRKIPAPLECYGSDQLVNLGDRLAISRYQIEPPLELQILSMDAEEENWSVIYSVNLLYVELDVSWEPDEAWLRTVFISKEGDIVFHDNLKGLFKYCQETDSIHSLSRDICVLSPFVENLVSLRPSSSSGTGYEAGFSYFEPRISEISGQVDSGIPKSGPGFPNIWLASAVAFVVLRYLAVSSRS